MSAPWMLLATSLFAALWPVWTWYFIRMTDGSDEPWGVAALLLALGLIAKRWRAEPIGSGRVLAVMGLLGVYALGFGTLPPLIRAMIAVTAVAMVFAPREGGLGIWGLLLLSLPVLATMQFYLGYPLRAFAAATSAGILGGLGLDVTRTGLTLWWRGEGVSVDAPCSGIKMLWGGFVLVSGLCAWRGAVVRATVGSMVAAFAVILAANILRVTLLFYKEAHVVHLPEWTHAAIGCLCFALAAGVILRLARFHERGSAV